MGQRIVFGGIALVALIVVLVVVGIIWDDESAKDILGIAVPAVTAIAGLVLGVEIGEASGKATGNAEGTEAGRADMAKKVDRALSSDTGAGNGGGGGGGPRPAGVGGGGAVPTVANVAAVRALIDGYIA